MNRPSARVRGLVIAITAAVASLAIVSPAHADSSYTIPPVNATFDYQIGGGYTPAAGVTVLSRDRGDSPAPGLYNICYINMMQTQPDEAGQSKTNPPEGSTAWYQKYHPNVLLKKSGKLVEDPNWKGEYLLDVRTAAVRAELAQAQEPWIQKCKSDGFQAVEPDNIDSETRSGGLLTHQNIRDYMKIIVPFTHAAGLAIAQKNALTDENDKPEWKTDGPTFVDTVSPRQGFDFAIIEECQGKKLTTGECDVPIQEYQNRIFEIEYKGSRFSLACTDHGSTVSVTLRDVDVTPRGQFKTC